MVKMLQFWGYVACMLSFVYLMASGALGSFRLGWRYLRTLVKHVAFLAAAGILVAAVITPFQ